MMYPTKEIMINAKEKVNIPPISIIIFDIFLKSYLFANNTNALRVPKTPGSSKMSRTQSQNEKASV